jgi:hypothetical protein
MIIHHYVVGLFKVLIHFDFSIWSMVFTMWFLCIHLGISVFECEKNLGFATCAKAVLGNFSRFSPVFEEKS